MTEDFGIHSWFERVLLASYIYKLSGVAAYAIMAAVEACNTEDDDDGLGEWGRSQQTGK